MSRYLNDFRVFIASPGGLEEERSAFKESIDEYNLSEAKHRGVQFTAVAWELTIGGAGRPQSLINKDLVECDYFILILHDRWGTNPNKKEGKYSSATEEEFYTALDCLQNPNYPMKNIIIFFKSVDDRQLSDPGEQLTQVLEFKKEREKEKDFLYYTFDSIRQFVDLFKRNLAHWVRDFENKQEDMPDNIIPLKVSRGSKAEPYKNHNLELAEEYAENERITDAEMIFSRIAINNTDPWALARYGRFLKKIGQYEKANLMLDSAIQLAEKEGDKTTKAYSLRQKATIFEIKGDLFNAKECYFASLSLFREINDWIGEGRVLRGLASLERKSGNLKESESLLQRAYSLYLENEDLSGVATTLGYLGLIYKTLGDYDKAIENYEESLKRHKELEDELALSRVKSNLGVIYRMQGDLAKAKVYHIESLEYYKKQERVQDISRELSNLGIVHREEGNYTEARKLFLESLELSDRTGNKQGMSIQYGNIGRIEKIEATIKIENGDIENGTKQLKKAESYFKDALALSKEINNSIGIASNKERLGVLYREQNQYDLAEEYLRKSLDEYKKNGAFLGECNVLKELGNTLVCKNEHKLAISYYREAIQGFLRIKMKDEADSLKDIVEGLE